MSRSIDLNADLAEDVTDDAALLEDIARLVRQVLERSGPPGSAARIAWVA